MKNLLPIQIEARNSLAKAARHLRSLRGTKAEEKLEWEKDDRGNFIAKVGKGKIILFSLKSKAAFLTVQVLAQIATEASAAFFQVLT